MHCDRTEPTTLRHAPLARRAAASETAADGFAALLGAAATPAERAPAPAERDRPTACHQQRGVDERGQATAPRRDDRAPSAAVDDRAASGEAPAAEHVPPVPAVAAPLATGAVATATAQVHDASAPPVAMAGVTGASGGPGGSGASASGGPAAGAFRGVASAATGDAAIVGRGAVPAVPGEAATVAAPALSPSGAPATAADPLGMPAAATTAPASAAPPAASATPTGMPPAVTLDAPTVGAGAPPAEAIAANAGADADLPTAAPRSDATATPQPATNADARGATAEPATASAPPEQPAGPSAPAAAAPTQPQPAAAQATPFADRAAPLHRAPRAVAQVLELAVERGISHAKLRLRPADLGGVEIRLQTSAAGVTAQVVADSPEAARLLQEAAADLRRALERHDVTLLSLDVSTAGDDRYDGSAGAGNDPAGERARHLAAHGLAPRGAGDEQDDQAAPVVATVQLPDGVHVDVLA